MNFIFIAPNFPDNYRFFCDRLNHNDVNVLGIGDRMVMCERMPEIFATAMGDQMYTAVLDTEEEVREYGLFFLDEQASIMS